MSDRSSVTAWHFLPDDGCLRYGAREKVKVGRVYKATGPLVLCENGMHASLKAIDALRYAPGALVCRVELRGEIVTGDDKLCARERKVLTMADATRTLRLFACWVAERALESERKAGREPDPRSWDAIRITRLWLDGKASDAAWAAARDAAWDAAWAAARDAARAAAGDAAWAAAWDAANKKLTAMLNDLLDGAR